MAPLIFPIASVALTLSFRRSRIRGPAAKYLTRRVISGGFMALEVFANLEKYGHEQLALFTNKDVGLKAIVAIHNTTLGPALGGCRMWSYASDLDAIEDCLRLSRGMTYKAAAAGLNLGGGKAVIVGDAKKQKSEGLFRAFGRFVES